MKWKVRQHEMRQREYEVEVETREEALEKAHLSEPKVDEFVEARPERGFREAYPMRRYSLRLHGVAGELIAEKVVNAPSTWLAVRELAYSLCEPYQMTNPYMEGAAISGTEEIRPGYKLEIYRIE